MIDSSINNYMMLKVAFLLRYWPFYGGGETVTRILVEELLLRGIEVHILYWWRNDANKIYAPSGSYYEYSFVVKRVGDYDPEDIADLSEKLEDYLNLNKIEFVINQWWPSGIIPKGIPSKVIKCWHTFALPNPHSGDNWIKDIRNTIFKKIRNKRYVKCCEDPFYDESDALVFLSSIYANEFIKYSSLFPLKNKVVAYIYNPSPYKNMPKVSMFEKKKEIIFVGRLEEPVKRISRILYSWKRILQYGNDDWKLKIIGDGPDYNELFELAHNLNLSDFEFTGSKDPKEDYKKASILLLTSQMEGWPMSIIEGKSYGVVPIAMKTFSAVNEIINDGVDGIICKSTDPNDFAEHILDIMYNKPKRELFAQVAIRNSQQYNVSPIVDEWIDLFHKLR